MTGASGAPTVEQLLAAPAGQDTPGVVAEADWTWLRAHAESVSGPYEDFVDTSKTLDVAGNEPNARTCKLDMKNFEVKAPAFRQFDEGSKAFYKDYSPDLPRVVDSAAVAADVAVVEVEG